MKIGLSMKRKNTKAMIESRVYIEHITKFLTIMPKEMFSTTIPIITYKSENIIYSQTDR